MNREDIIRMAREAGFDPHDMSDDFTCNLEDIEHFAALVAAAERNKLAAWMMSQGYATGHGDSIEKLLEELEWQIEERIRNERSACARVCEILEAEDDSFYAEFSRAKDCAAAIRARGGK